MTNQTNISEGQTDLPDTTATTGRVQVGGSVTGEIESGSDRDSYGVELVAGRTYRIDLEGADTNAGTLSDPALRWIKNAAGTGFQGTNDDDGGTDNNARQEFTPTESGTYYLSARGEDGETGTYTLSVTDITPNRAPSFAESGYAFDLAENEDGSGTAVALGTVSATDPERTALTYSIVSGNGGGLFAIEAATGALTYVGSGEDYESGTTSHTLTLRASDGDLHGDTSVTVNVTAVNEAPSFAESSYAFDLAENEDGSGTAVALGTVSATDPERTTLTYSIASGNGGGLFAIDSGTGALTYVGSGEDYESETTSHTLTLRASDGDLHADTSVTVNVTAVNEAPSFAESSYAFDLAENEDGSGTAVALGTVSATDPERTTLTYSIASGNGGGLFAIDSGTGALTYVGSGEDYESGTTSHTLTVRASDGELHGDTSVTVSITDVEEQTQTQTQTQTQQQTVTQSQETTDLPDTTATTGRVQVGGSVTGSIESGSDRDSYGVELVAGRTYRIDLEGADTNAGTLSDPALRWIKNAAGTGFKGTNDNDGGTDNNARQEFEPTQSGTYYLSVRGEDGETGTYTLTVTDITPNRAPSFAESSYAFDLAENEDGSGTAVALGTVSATDPERTALTYSIVSGNGGGLFAIDSGTGALTYVGSGEDYESGTTSHTLTLRASDGSLHGDTSVTVNVTAVNEAPSFAESSYAFDLAENEDGSGTAVALGTVSATDPERTTLTYSIASGNEGSLFAVDSGTGALTYVGSGEDYESGTTSHTLTLRASDGNLHGDTSVTVNVTDVDEQETQQQTTLTSVSEAPGTDFSDSRAGSIGRVLVGESATGYIATPVREWIDLGHGIQYYGARSDRDVFEVTLEAGTPYQVDLEGARTGAGTLRDPYLRGIYDSNGYLVSFTSDDDGGVGRNSRVAFEPETGGTYYISAGAYGSGSGTYRLSLKEISDDDYADGTDTTGTVTVGGSATGKIGHLNDRDWFAVTVDAGKAYWVDLKGSGTGALGDPYLRGIRDSDGNLINNTSNDNIYETVSFGTNLNSRVLFLPDADGTYYIDAGASGGSAGTYRLSVTEINDEYSSGTDTTGAITVGGSAVTSKIEYEDDRDWFEVTFEANTEYRIDLKNTGSPLSWQPKLHGIHDSEGNLIAGTSRSDGGESGDSRVFFEAKTAGTYYIAAGSAWEFASTETVGHYSISATEVNDDDRSADTSTTGTVAAGGSATGEIEREGDRDWFKIELDADESYRIDLKGVHTNSGTLSDPFIAGIYNSDGDLIANTSDDDSGTGRDAQLVFDPTADGDYYIAVGGWERLFGSAIGTYELSVDLIA